MPCRVAAANARSAGPARRTVLCSSAFLDLGNCVSVDSLSCNSVHDDNTSFSDMLLAKNSECKCLYFRIRVSGFNSGTPSPTPSGQITKRKSQNK